MAEQKVKLAQCLCPARHCILASLGFGEVEEMKKNLQTIVEGMVEKKALNPWCLICGSTDWHYEVGRTRFTDLTEAASVMVEEAAKQAHSRERLRQLGLLYDQQPKH